jgi:hypothetical protein
MRVSIYQTGNYYFACGVDGLPCSRPSQFSRSADTYDFTASNRDRAIFDNAPRAVHRDNGPAGDKKIDSCWDTSGVSLRKTRERHIRRYEETQNQSEELVFHRWWSLGLILLS